MKLKNKGDIKLLFIADTISNEDRLEIGRMNIQFMLLSDVYIDDDFKDRRILIEGRTAHDLYEYLKSVDFMPSIIRANSERFIVLKAQLSKLFDLPYRLSEESAELVSQKDKMRQRFIEKAPEVTPSYALISSQDDIKKFIDMYGLPVMLKPTGLDRSMLIARAESIEEALEVFASIQSRIEYIYEKRRIKSEPKIIIEEYMTGPKYSVEGIVDSNGILHTPGTITDLWFGYDIGIDDPMNHLRIAPSLQDKKTVDKIIDCTQKGVTALEMTSTPIHAELIMVKGTPKIIEIAARVGGYRQEMYSRSLGISIFEQELNMLISDTIDLTPKKDVVYSAAFKAYAKDEGVLSYITNLDIFEDKSCKRYVLKNHPGDKVGPAKFGYKELLFAIFVGNTKEEILKITAEATEKVQAVLEK